MTLASEALEETTLANRKVEKMEKVVAGKKMQLAAKLHSTQAKTAVKYSAKRTATKSSSLERIGCDEIKKRRLLCSIIKQMDQGQNCL